MLQVPANTGWQPEFKLSSTPPFLAATSVLRSTQAGRELNAGLDLCFVAFAGLKFHFVPKRSANQRDDIWHQKKGVWLGISLKNRVLLLQVS